ncbi:hypothetical protein SAMN04489844_4046 [Nocardioides exalbidus]|uniref:Uncharacterized protein n=1 Tax=Nocardioides exalbidus TaxID=402596 RepID=A0A1H4Z903_9ACTN|nr:hypothetical protein SAMN04489844_4046 [Nocardioides exalbidus]
MASGPAGAQSASVCRQRPRGLQTGVRGSHAGVACGRDRSVGRAAPRRRGVVHSDPALVALPRPCHRARSRSPGRCVPAPRRRRRRRPATRVGRPTGRRCHVRRRPVTGVASLASVGVLRGVRGGLPRRDADRPLHRASLGAAAGQPLLPGSARSTQERRGRPGRHSSHLRRPRPAGRSRSGDGRPPAGVRAPACGVGPRRCDPFAPHPTGGASAHRGAGGGHRTRARSPVGRRGAVAHCPGAA